MKNSYMKIKHIISEATLKDFMKYFKIFKKFNIGSLSGSDKKLLKDPKVKRAFLDFNKSLNTFNKQIDARRKEAGLPPFEN